MRIYDLMSMDDLSAEILSGYVSVEDHPTLVDHRIYRLTDKSRAEVRRNAVANHIDGLVVKGETVIMSGTCIIDR